MRLILPLLAALAAALPAAAASPAQRVAAMHPIERPAIHPSHPLVILYSGDGGWSGFDNGVAERLAAAGAPVVGISSLRYFLFGRSAEEAAADLAALIETHAPRSGDGRIVLAGFSFGADALPEIVPRLPAATRAKIARLILIAPSDRGELKFQLGDWTDHVAPYAFPLAPRLASLKGLPMTCIWGARDRKAACTRFDPALIHAVRLPGDHHFNRDTAAVARAVLAAGTPAPHRTS